MIPPPKHHRIETTYALQLPGDAQLSFYCLEAAFEIAPPAVVHKIVVVMRLVQIDADAGMDEGQIEAPSVVGVDGIHAIQRFKKRLLLHPLSHQLHQPALAAINQIDAYHGDIVVRRRQPGGLNVNMGV